MTSLSLFQFAELATKLARERNEQCEIRSAPMLLKLLLRRLGATAVQMGRYDQARGWLLESLQLASNQGDPYAVAHVQMFLGEAACCENKPEEARDWLQPACSFLKKAMTRSRLSQALVLLGWAELQMGEQEQARIHLQEARTLAEESETTSALFFSWIWLARLALAVQDFAEARRLLDASIEQTSAGQFRQLLLTGCHLALGRYTLCPRS